MIWATLYGVALLALFVRFQDPEQPRRQVPSPAPGEPLDLVAWHHRVVYSILLVAPLEASVVGSVPGGRLLGVTALAFGVGLYRWGASRLGDALSPFVHPVPGATVVRAGPYRWIRHPMYLGHVLIALGAPLTLGVRWTLLMSAAAIVVIGRRLLVEERVLTATLPGYGDYATRTKRVVPYVL